jgi:hypothetical protein
MGCGVAREPLVPTVIGEANRPAPHAGASKSLDDTDAEIRASVALASL